MCDMTHLYGTCLIHVCVWHDPFICDMTSHATNTTALEHKVFCRAFADKFPEALLYVPPGLFNFVPGVLFGMGWGWMLKTIMEWHMRWSRCCCFFVLEAMLFFGMGWGGVLKTIMEWHIRWFALVFLYWKGCSFLFCFLAGRGGIFQFIIAWRMYECLMKASLSLPPCFSHLEMSESFDFPFPEFYICMNASLLIPPCFSNFVSGGCLLF